MEVGAGVDAPNPGSTAGTGLSRIRAIWAGDRVDWGFSALAFALVAAGYYDAWINRHLPVKTWEHAPAQAAWLLVVFYLGALGLRQWRADRRPAALIPEGYSMSVIGCIVFLTGIVVGGYWTTAFGPEFGLPALFRPSNVLQVAGAALIVSGPLRAAVGRGELFAGPTAVLSAGLLLATVTFFTQFDHPYVDQWAVGRIAPVVPLSWMEEELGALGLLLQTMVVVGVVLWVIRQVRLPVGAITLMLAGTTVCLATQLGHYNMLLVTLTVGALTEVALVVARPRADRVHTVRIFAVFVGALLPGVYLADLAVSAGIWWEPDVVYGTILACALAGGAMSYVVFPGANAIRAASVLWPVQEADSSPSAPDVTIDRVEHALKVMHSTRGLSESPLVHLRSLPAANAQCLRQAIDAAIEALRTSAFQVDAQAGEILNLYYVRRIGGHYPVMVRVGLSRAAYFNRRSYAVRRLVDRMRELEESASTV